METRRPRIDRLYYLVTVVSLVVAASYTTPWLHAAEQPSLAANDPPAIGAPAHVSRGVPGVKIHDGRRLESPGFGAATPLALTSGDFDEDGVLDLVIGMHADGQPRVVLYRGNVDAIYPGTPEAQDRRASGQFTASPFWPPVVVDLAIAPDFLVAGDFDADGHCDLAAVSRNDTTLVWLPGDGQGGFSDAQFIQLPGRPTAMVAGDVDRPDGLADLVLGVTAKTGPEALVLSDASGALNADPQIIQLPAPATAVTLGQFDDDDALVDVAVLAGRQLFVRHGGNRGVAQQQLPFDAVTMAVGSFGAGDNDAAELALLDDRGALHLLTRRHGAAGDMWQVARSTPAALPSDDTRAPLLVTAKTSGASGDDVVVIDRGRKRLLMVPPRRAGAAPSDSGDGSTASADAAVIDTLEAPVAVLSMRLNADAMSDLVVVQDFDAAATVMLTAPAHVFTVNDPGDAPDCNLSDNRCATGPLDSMGNCVGACTFRAALDQANAASDLDAIEFALGPGTPTIVKPGGSDWTAMYPVTIDGNTGGADRVHLDANGIGNTLIVRGGSSTIRNLVITGGNPGIYVPVNGGNIFEGNWIGLDPSGSVARPNAGQGMQVPTGNNTIGGTTAGARNIISGNAQNGISISNGAGNQVIGNYIGTDATGTLDIGNRLSGIRVELANNTVIGGAVAGARNVISGNDGTGTLDAGVVANISPGLRFQGNYVGTSASGNTVVGNAGVGVKLVSGGNEVIGGTTTAARNIISGNGSDGVLIRSPRVSTNTVVQGNYIGVAANGSLRGNAGAGISIQGAHDNTVGGTGTGARNVIAGNAQAGVSLILSGEDPVRNSVRGNSIDGNGLLGFDLNADGVTANDPCDTDTGANGRQNFPILTSVSGLVTVQGTLNSTPNTTFTLDFYYSATADSSGYGEGQTFIGSKTVTTNASCVASFTATFSKSIPAGSVVTATATDPLRNTSEFSPGVGVPAALAVTAPNTAVNWGIGTVQKITWTHNLPAGSTVDIDVSRDGGITYTTLATAVKNGATGGTYNWTVSGPATAQARIRVTSSSPASVTDVSNVNFSIADAFVTVVKPNLASDVWTVGTTQTVQWTNNLGTLEKVTIELSKDGGVTYPIVLVADTPSDGKQAFVVQSAWATPTARVRVTWAKNTAVTDSSEQNFPIQ